MSSTRRIPNKKAASTCLPAQRELFKAKWRGGPCRTVIPAQANPIFPFATAREGSGKNGHCGRGGKMWEGSQGGWGTIKQKIKGGKMPSALSHLFKVGEKAQEDID